MSFEEILESIKKQKADRLREISGNSDDEVAQLLSKTAAEVSEYSKNLQAKAKLEREQIMSREMSKAAIKAKSVYNGEVNAAIESTIDAIMENYMKYMKTSQYKKLIAKLASVALEELGDDCTIIISKEDAKLISKGKQKFVLADAGSEFVGGLKAISKDGKREVDYTLKSIIENSKNDIANKVLEFIKE
ncbi:MAG: hypothetical protein M1128_01195 [Candidatus Marsarchaeota archaeon]|nr:hypothetical protein [Candidatus Marsarchaeota archaeon]